MPEERSLADQPGEFGPVRTRGRSYRARAEARQRSFRVNVLKAGYQRFGHLLSPEAAEAGHNFIHADAWAAVRARAATGRGMHRERTLANMLSSPAMAFNLLAPLAGPEGLGVAALMLRRFVPDVATVSSIRFEVTPPPELFRDSADCSSVACDAIIEYQSDKGQPSLIAVECMFVETEFCQCAFRDPAQTTPCTVDVVVTDQLRGCRYVSHKGFSYFDRSRRMGTFNVLQTRQAKCPWGGPMWPLYINHTLTHALAEQKHMARGTFALCAPAGNERLKARQTLDLFAEFLTDRHSAVFLPLDEVIEDLRRLVPPEPAWRAWTEKLTARYMVE